MSNPTTSRDAAAFAIPRLPGKTDIDRREMRSCWQGDRRAAYEASRKRLGITREAVWIQQLPSGDIAIVHLEADDLNRALTGITTSEDPFDRWLREHSLEVHGVDLKAGLPPLEQVLDFRS
ncbi:MAG: hypothetical protein K0S14_48 [Thermomicrobiales bacterium]|nr:hypothetical protein [Thermomicrobiales bacterium]